MHQLIVNNKKSSSLYSPLIELKKHKDDNSQKLKGISKQVSPIFENKKLITKDCRIYQKQQMKGSNSCNEIKFKNNEYDIPEEIDDLLIHKQMFEQMKTIEKTSLQDSIQRKQRNVIWNMTSLQKYKYLNNYKNKNTKIENLIKPMNKTILDSKPKNVKSKNKPKRKNLLANYSLDTLFNNRIMKKPEKRSTFSKDNSKTNLNLNTNLSNINTNIILHSNNSLSRIMMKTPLAKKRKNVVTNYYFLSLKNNIKLNQKNEYRAIQRLCNKQSEQTLKTDSDSTNSQLISHIKKKVNSSQKSLKFPGVELKVHIFKGLNQKEKQNDCMNFSLYKNVYFQKFLNKFEQNLDQQFHSNLKKNEFKNKKTCSKIIKERKGHTSQNERNCPKF